MNRALSEADLQTMRRRRDSGSTVEGSVREEFSRWDGYPSPKGAFQDVYVDVDAVCEEVAQLRRLLVVGDCHHDVRTLRNIQEQRLKVIAAAEQTVNNPAQLEMLAAALHELRRIGGVQ